MKKTWYLIIAIVLLIVSGLRMVIMNTVNQRRPRIKNCTRSVFADTHALPVFATKELETADGPVHVELVKYGSWPELMDALNTGK